VKITVVGDVLLDVDLAGAATRLSPDTAVPVIDVDSLARRAGGAGLVARMLVGDGHEVTLVTVLGEDVSAGYLRSELGGIRVVSGPSGTATPVKTRIWANAQPVARVDEACGTPSPPDISDRMLSTVDAAGAIVVADYGRGLTADRRLRRALQDRGRVIPVVWDPHPKGTAPVSATWIATPNIFEAVSAADLQGKPGPGDGGDIETATRAAAVLHERWSCGAVAVTLGEQGALLHLHPGPNCAPETYAPMVIPGHALDIADPCGAGDRLAATVITELSSGAGIHEAVVAGVEAATSFLAAGGVGASTEHREKEHT
jgi:D-beta-D-heptose 7-phosphate kinase / D-beta-D-heptose 1-phosphate adenosyltransferase